MGDTSLSILKKLASQSDPMSQRMSAMEVTLKTLDENQNAIIEAVMKHEETLSAHDQKLTQIDLKLDRTDAKIDALKDQISLLIQMGSRGSVNVVTAQNANIAETHNGNNS